MAAAPPLPPQDELLDMPLPLHQLFVSPLVRPPLALPQQLLLRVLQSQHRRLPHGQD